MALRRGIILAASALTAAFTAAVGVLPAAGHAEPVRAQQAYGDGMPDQARADLAAADPANSAHNPGWADLPGGIDARPYVRALNVVNGDTVTPVITDGGATPPAPAPGGVTAVVSPLNLCPAGQDPQPGHCYATPNRVALTVGYAAGTGMVGYNFADPSVAVTPAVGADTEFDVTVVLNTLGRSLRWTWVNGDLLYWRATDLGREGATVHLRFRPASTPYVAAFPPANGCTATPIRDCDIPAATAQFLAANLVFSLDDTLDPALTGAVFATRNAVAGYLAPGGTQAAPTLDLQASSAHTDPDGQPELGTVQAFLPAATLVNLYGVLPADAATAFAVTRGGDPGSNDPPRFTPWTAGAHGSDGLLVTVTGITFSVPDYRVAGRLQPTATRAQVSGRRTTVTATVAGCTRTGDCLASLYALGTRGVARYTTRALPVLTNQRLRSAALSLAAPASRLRHGDRYLLVVRSARTRRALVSTTGTVR